MTVVIDEKKKLNMKRYMLTDLDKQVFLARLIYVFVIYDNTIPV